MTPMTVAILADDVLKQELLAGKLPADVTVVWVDSLRALLIAEADAYMDLLFDMDVERTQRLKQLLPKPVLINAVSWSTKKIGADFIRINAWPGLLQRPITEIALPAGMSEASIQWLFNDLQWKYILTPDIAGMITARVLAAIINEAYYTLGAQEEATRQQGSEA
jgi:3-hydroxybutyryl-CoA dehydrogenase